MMIHSLKGMHSIFLKDFTALGHQLCFGNVFGPSHVVMQ